MISSDAATYVSRPRSTRATLPRSQQPETSFPRGVEHHQGVSNEIERSLDLAVPEAPTDELDDVGKPGAFLQSPSVASASLDRLGDVLNAHREMKPIEHVTGRADARRLAQGSWPVAPSLRIVIAVPDVAPRPCSTPATAVAVGQPRPARC